MTKPVSALCSLAPHAIADVEIATAATAIISFFMILPDVIEDGTKNQGSYDSSLE